jgi:hypothetical protein
VNETSSKKTTKKIAATKKHSSSVGSNVPKIPGFSAMLGMN